MQVDNIHMCQSKVCNSETKSRTETNKSSALKTHFTAQQIRFMTDSSGGRFVINWLVSLQPVHAIAPNTVN